MSGNKNFAYEGFEVNAIDYLLKPLSLGRFLQAINKFHLQIQANQEQSSLSSNGVPENSKPDYLFVKENKRIVKIFLNEIVFIESLKDYLKITTEDKTLLIKHQLSQFEAKLGRENFLRIHKSFLISINKIVAYSASKIELGNIELPIGRSYKQKVIQTLENLFLLHS
ncbi:response regulator transcription factor [Cytophagales bacterium RKSG123]|nr:response regulator transcription factor [Xanthovirga aplysinae]